MSLGRAPAKIAGIAAVMAAVVGAAPEAHAQVLSRFALRLEGGVAFMIPPHQRNNLGDKLGFGFTPRLSFNIIDPLAIQVGFSNWFFPGANGGTGRVMSLTGGLRLEPKIGSVGRLFASVNGGWAWTGPDQRVTIDGGLGFEFQATRWLGIGPAVYVGAVFQRGSQPFSAQHAWWLAGGLSITLRVPPPEERQGPVDTDRDGVLDPDDQCVEIPQGDHPDPNRAGCPVADTDNDGIYDNEDQCPTEPAGATPDPNRRGCPMSDRDHDGVTDAEDQCPSEPAGATPDPVRRGCPRGDQDHDSIFDDEDQCPTEPAGARPSTVRRGCPVPDADHDGIIDQPEGPDRCPTQPETFNGNQDDDGCPDGASLAEMSGGQIRILQQVNFRTNSDEIRGRESFQVLDAVASVLRAVPSIATIDVQGHTDDRGDAAHNLDLSNRRAASVKRYLTEHGIDAGRLDSHGFGPNCPLQPGSSRQARDANRRVQFVIVSAESPAGRCVNAPTGSNGTVSAPVTTPTVTDDGGGRHGRHGHHGGGGGHHSGGGHHGHRGH